MTILEQAYQADVKLALFKMPALYHYGLAPALGAGLGALTAGEDRRLPGALVGAGVGVGLSHAIRPLMEKLLARPSEEAAAARHLLESSGLIRPGQTIPLRDINLTTRGKAHLYAALGLPIVAPAAGGAASGLVARKVE